MSGEVGQSIVGEQAHQEHHNAHAEGSSTGGQSSIPAITVTEAVEEVIRGTEAEEEMPPPQLTETDESGDARESSEDQSVDQEIIDLADEGGDGVSSEGEKLQAVEEMEEGSEAEASESSTSHTERRIVRGNTARRSMRSAFRNRRVLRPTPIIWNEPGSTSPRGRAMLVRGQNDPQRGNFPRGLQRVRRMRGKPKGNFPPYQMRF
ncbi:hypothetical protein C0J52_27657 [Blattella germanica]|nr:hypothetical protein C0J52_27657 [Blattella germanica]